MFIKGLGIKIKESYITLPVTRDAIFISKLISKENFKTVLEIGTGTGIISIYLAKNGCKVTANDIDEKIIKLAKDNAKLNSANIKFVISDLYNNIKGKYDCIIFSVPFILSKTFNYLSFLYEKIIPSSIEPYTTRLIDTSFVGKKFSKYRRNKLKYFLELSERYLNKNGYIYLIVFESDLSFIKELDNIKYEKIKFPFFTYQSIIRASYKK